MRARLLRSLLAALLLIAAMPPAASGRPFVATVRVPAPPATGPRAAPDRILVRFRDGSASGRSRVLRRHGLTEAKSLIPERGVSAVRVPAGRKRDDVLRELRSDPGIVYAEPDAVRYVSAYAEPDDPGYTDPTTYSNGETSAGYGKSWWLRGSGLDAAEAWRHGYSDPAGRDFPVRAPASAFKVAVIDTGFYLDHPDRGANIVAGHDFFNSCVDGVFHEDDDVTPPPSDAPDSNIGLVSHGTCTAGEVAAATRNGVGVASVGYDAQVVVYKVAGQVYGMPSFKDGSVQIFSDPVVAAIRRAADDGCRIISMSLGGPDYVQAEQDAVDYAWSKGCVVVASTGNSGSSGGVLYPARCAHVVGVGAYGVAGGVRHVASFTDYGPGLDILAPGDLVYGLFAPGVPGSSGVPAGYGFWSGTSMAAPALAGAIAHLWRYVPALANDQIVDLVQRTAAPYGSSRPDAAYGWGYADMSSAMASITATYAYLAPPTLHLPATPVPGDYLVSWDAVPGHSVTYEVWRDGSLASTTTGTSRSLALATGGHTLCVRATSVYDYCDGASATTATVTVGGGVITPTGNWGGWQPSGWAATTSPLVSVQARDETSGLVPGTAEFRWTADSGASWSEWASGTLTCLPGSASTETLSARVPFGRDSDDADQVQFRVTNGASLVGTSPPFTVRVDSTPPTGTAAVPSTVSSTAVPVTSSVTDAHLTDMRLSGDGGATWTAWQPYSAETTVQLPAGRGTKTVKAQYRDEAGNALTLTRSVLLDIPLALVRLQGPNRYETALSICRQHFARADTVVVATGADFADALSASALAGSYGAPLLLTTPASLYGGIATEIARLGATRAIVVGSERSVSRQAFAQLDALPGVSVERLWGDDRYGTAAAIANAVVAHERALGRTMPNEYFLVRGDQFADALAVSPFAYHRRMPIVLTRSTGLPSPAWSAIGAIDPTAAKKAVIAGGTLSVGTRVTSSLSAAGRRWERVSGNTRYDTAGMLADTATARGWADWGFVGVATGQSFADGLDGGAASGASGGVLLLTPRSPLASQVSSRLRAHSSFVERIEVFGGEPTIAGGALNEIAGIF